MEGSSKSSDAVIEKSSSEGCTNRCSDVDTAAELSPNTDEARFEKTIWWKVDRYILPVAILIYLLSWIDRTNIGNARVAGLQDDLQLSAAQYSMALTVTFIPYILTELPSNLTLKIIGPNILLPTLLVCWGLVSTLQGVVKNYSGFIACRFFLGFFEGGLFPGLVLYLSCFYPRNLLQFRISALFSSVALSGAFSGLLATAISKMDGIGGRPAWAWIFILEGLFTILFGIISFWILPNGPETALFLSREEKDYVIKRLTEANNAGNADSGEFSWREVGEAFKSPHVLFLAVNTFFGSSIVYSLAYFAPSIVFSLGFSPIRTQLMSVPPFAAAFVVSLTAAYLADKYHARGITVMLSSLCCIAGFAMYLGSTEKWVLYGSLFLTIGGSSSMGPAHTTWQANNTSPHIRRATGIAFLIMMANCSGILSIWLFGSLSPPPRYTEAMVVMLVFSCLIELVVVVNMAYLWAQNKKKRRIREMTKKTDEPAGLGDRSAWFEYIL